MTFVPNKPDAGPAPSIDVSTIQGNFAKFASTLAANHVAMNLKNQGDHKYVIFNKKTVNPIVNTNQVTLFSKDYTSKADTQPQLFVRIKKFLPTEFDSKNAKNDIMMLTYNKVDIAGPQYQSFLPGGYFLIFGMESGNTVLNTAFAPITVILTEKPKKLLAVVATSYTLTSGSPPNPQAMNVSAVINTTLNDRFTLYSTGNNSGAVRPYQFGWVAIGTI